MNPTDAPHGCSLLDDDSAMAWAIQGLLKSVGLRSEPSDWRTEFLHRKRPDGPKTALFWT